MKELFRDILIVLAVTCGLWLSMVTIPSWHLQKNYKNADTFCKSVKAGLASSEAISLAKENTTKRRLVVESDQIRLYFGSGCRCIIRFANGKAIPNVGMCID